MKNLNNIFYDILLKIEKKDPFLFQTNTWIIDKYFYDGKNQDREKIDKLAKYLEEFQNFCFDLDVNNVLNGSINFKFR